MFTDTHTHLYLPDFDHDREQVVATAAEKKIGRFFLPNIDSSSVEKMLSVWRAFPGKMFPMTGLHPCSVKENWEEELSLVEKSLSSGEIRWAGIGEIGIDLYWDKTFSVQQEIVFRKQLELAVKNDLAVVIHSRNAMDEIYSVLVDIRNQKPFTSKNIRGVFHCFSGTPDQAKRIIEFGNFWIGIGGVVTFRNSGLEEIVRNTDLRKIVLETDSPYLAPVPYRGKRNEPGYLIEVAKKIAEIKNVSMEEVEKTTTENSIEVFGV